MGLKIVVAVLSFIFLVFYPVFREHWKPIIIITGIIAFVILLIRIYNIGKNENRWN